ncbi:MAG: ABC transporter permease [Bacteroidales bacterium]|nr:ABC transporter permease [Candidatus Latescibacterota bacterium]
MNDKRHNPPRLAERILAHVASTTEPAALLGDLEEEFCRRAEMDSIKAAKAWYWQQIMRSIPPFTVNSTVWSMIMISNYIKVAIRNMTRHKTYTIINLAGLAIGIACSVLMLMWVADELSFDRFHSKSDRIYRLLVEPYQASGKPLAVSAPILAGKMQDEFPEVENAVRMRNSSTLLMSAGESKFYESSGILADPSFFEIFDFPFIKGDPATALTDLYSIVLTESLAEKYFGKENPIGKTVRINNKTDFLVTGVIADIPGNSHLRFGFVRPFDLLKEAGRDFEDWGAVSYHTYALLYENASPAAVDEKLIALINREEPDRTVNYYLQPLKETHLHSDFVFDNAVTGNILYVYIFSAGAIFILLIACINFMNLATARSGIRAREVGMRKVVGAARSDIIRQFFGESILASMIALAVAIALIQTTLPFFNELSGKELAFNLLATPQLAFGLLALTLVTGLISGSYPALFLSSFKPVKVLKGSRGSTGSGSKFRRVLVVLQFSLTIILIIGTMVVHQQLGHIRSRELGYDSDHIIVMPMRGEIRTQHETLKEELIKDPAILSVTAASSIPTNISISASSGTWEGKPEDVSVQIHINTVDYSYLETFKMEMASGEFFSKDRTTDADNFVVNEAAVAAMGLSDPIGAGFDILGSEESTIIGVVKDFNYESARTNIEPMVMVIADQWKRYVCVRINGNDISGAISTMESNWKDLAPAFPFEYSFLDERIDALYRAEQRMMTLFNYFTGLAMFIACLGLFGMASFTAERRTKEIGIRKALGASETDIVKLLSMEFSKLVLLANVIAWPVAWLAMNRWLQSFAYRVDLSIWVFAAAGAAAFAVAFLTVASQAIKAAVTRPVEALKYE